MKKSILHAFMVLMIIITNLSACGLNPPEITSTPSWRPLLTRTPWNTYVRLPSYTYGPSPTPRPTRTQTPYGYVLTFTPYPTPIDVLTPDATSIYYVDPSGDNSMTLGAHCADLVYRLDTAWGHITTYQNNYFFVDQLPQEYDPDLLMNLFTHLHMEDGYVLDSIGRLLYARALGSPALSNFYELQDQLSNLNLGQSDIYNEFLNHVEVDGTPQSYFQFTLLLLLSGSTFELGEYFSHDLLLLCQNGNIDRLLEYQAELVERVSYNDFTPEFINALQNLNLAPEVTITDDWVQVRVTTFSHESGVSERYIYYSVDFPHRILDMSERVLLLYEKGTLE